MNVTRPAAETMPGAPGAALDAAADAALGGQMHALCERLFPICRSITGDGVRQTLAVLREYLPALEVEEVPTGTRCFDWEIPPEWNIRSAWLEGPDGGRVLDFADSNLHVVGYSTPVDRVMDLDELQPHLHSLPEQPDAIPYVTSYYRETWGLCLPHRQRESLPPGRYRVHIDSELRPGSLSYGELVLPGQSDSEVLLSTYICHPSLANNELSGPVVTTFLARWLAGIENRRHTYRIVFVPETIGAIAYLSRHLAMLKARVVAGYQLTCIGDERVYSYLASRHGDTLADRAAVHVLSHMHAGFVRYDFLARGSDERQYCSPGVDLPVASIMRSKYGTYPEYHTSLDNLELVTAAGLAGSLQVLREVVACIERNRTYRATVPCEPQLGRRGLFPTLSTKHRVPGVRVLLNVLAYCDGTLDLIALADRLGMDVRELYAPVDLLLEHGLIEAVEA